MAVYLMVTAGRVQIEEGGAERSKMIVMEPRKK
jgi:hypothetical protein